MNISLIKELENIVEETCKQESNVYGYEAWKFHIQPVISLSSILADKLQADKEIVVISSILHDYASVSNKEFYQEHHIHGMKLADELLQKYGYPREKIEMVKQCIFSHRASKQIERLSKEEICLASADAMAHIDQIPSLFHLALVKKKLSVEQAAIFIMNKIERSYQKCCQEAKDMIQSKYDAAKILLKEYQE